MKNLITYNEAIRWYKNGKLEPNTEPEIEPENKKDLTVIIYNGTYYLLSSYESLIDGTILKNFTLYNSKQYGLPLSIKIPSKIKATSMIRLFNEKQHSSQLCDLPQDMIDRISNEIVY